MTSSQEILAAIDKALNEARRKIYYITDVNCKKTDEGGTKIYLAIAPNMTCPHQLFMMHPDNLPAFLGACTEKHWVAVDQREWWKEEEVKFRKTMADNAWAYGNMMIDRQEKRGGEL